ncbi:MAG: hypothetical protein AB1451_16450 [Nitrospirota bacterium]
MLVSSNTAFARAAYEYGKQHDQSCAVSSVITDFSLANMAWLKAPMGAPSVPMTEVLAYSYAALRPSKDLLDRYLTEIDKLQKQGRISERDHQLLRSSTVALEELMRLTLGDEAALTEETVTETLRRVSAEIRKEENEKVREEQEAHRQTRQQLAAAASERESLQKRLYWKARRNSQFVAWGVSASVGVLLLVGVAEGLGMRTQNATVGWLLVGGSSLVAMGTILNMFFGTTVRHLHEAIQTKCVTYLLRREARETGINFGVDR